MDGPVEGCELRPLTGIHDLGRAELVARIVQRFDAAVSIKRVGDAPSKICT
jgi:hypothetical protein